MKLYSLYESLILEGVSKDVIFEAIESHYRVKITYAGDDNTGGGERIIEVYAHGHTRGKEGGLGNEVIRAFQTKGVTSGGGVQGWKLFRVDRITNWEPVMKANGRPDLFALGDRSSGFNPNGDKKMTGDIKVADFNNYG